jgi:signal transduction histidine kinase
MGTPPSNLLIQLQANRQAVVDRWFHLIATTSFSPHPASEIRLQLDELTDRAIQTLVGLEFSEASATAIGSRLANLHYLSPRALAGTLEAFGNELLAGLPEFEARRLQPRLIELLGALASGYYAAARRLILEEQDAVRAALFVTRQQAEAAQEARAIAEASAQARSDLLARVAHDLRSPLTTIKGQADLIAQRLNRDIPPVDWLRSRLNSIRSADERMQKMIGELLDAARLQLGERLDLELAPIDVVELSRRVVHRMETGSVLVRLEADDEPLVMTVDRARIERVLENLLSNAIKYSLDFTPVDIVVRRIDAGVRFRVQDRGVGIPADELPLVTRPFYRASTARAIPGVGLGLAGVKAIVEQHGGEVHIESVVGEGTQVTLTLPAST